jgi:hypothetical protein
VQIPDGKPAGWDIADAIAQGMTVDGIEALISSARMLNPPPLDLFGDTSIAGAPDLPQGSLPAAIELFARDETKRLGVDPGVMALACIVTATASIDDRYIIQPKDRDPGWRESARLWGAIVDEVGTKKSAIIKSATAPILEFELAKRADGQTALEHS